MRESHGVAFGRREESGVTWRNRRGMGQLREERERERVGGGPGLYETQAALKTVEPHARVTDIGKRRGQERERESHTHSGLS